ncbi:MAG: PIN domain-containing protein [Neisseriaceae bacterium]|nr:MAG: PIN domain-containing protein [Neisseriaceae bacterium]
MKAMFDSNILMDYLNQVDASRDVLSQYQERYISLITYIEVLAGAKTLQDEYVIKGFLNKFHIIIPNVKIGDQTVKLRKEYRFKLPDALIVASSIEQDIQLFTRDENLLNKFANVVIPYRL